MADKARLTLDMTSEEHSYLKMACAKLTMSMRHFMLLATFEKLEELEDIWLAEKARQVLERLRSGEEKTIPWRKARAHLA